MYLTSYYYLVSYCLASQGLRFRPYEDPFSHQSVLETDSPKELKKTPSHDQQFSESTTSPNKEDVVPSPKKSVSQPTAKVVWGPSGYTGNKIKKASEGPDKMPQSSSERSSSGDFPAEKPSQKCEETTKTIEVSSFGKWSRAIYQYASE